MSITKCVTKHFVQAPLTGGAVVLLSIPLDFTQSIANNSAGIVEVWGGFQVTEGGFLDYVGSVRLVARIGKNGGTYEVDRSTNFGIRDSYDGGGSGFESGSPESYLVLNSPNVDLYASAAKIYDDGSNSYVYRNTTWRLQMRIFKVFA